MPLSIRPSTRISVRSNKTESDDTECIAQKARHAPLRPNLSAKYPVHGAENAAAQYVAVYKDATRSLDKPFSSWSKEYRYGPLSYEHAAFKSQWYYSPRAIPTPSPAGILAEKAIGIAWLLCLGHLLSSFRSNFARMVAVRCRVPRTALHKATRLSGWSNRYPDPLCDFCCSVTVCNNKVLKVNLIRYYLCFFLFSL